MLQLPRIGSSIFALAAAVGLVGFAGWMSNVADAQKAANRQKASVSKQGDPGKNQPPDSDPYAVPDASPEELLEFIEKQGKLSPDPDSGISFFDHLRKVHTSIIHAADKILAAEAGDEMHVAAVQAKFSSLGRLLRLGDKTAVDKARQFGESLKKDKRPEIVAEATMRPVIMQLQFIQTLDDKQREQLLVDVMALLEDGEMTPIKFQIGMMTASSLERSGDTKLAANIYTRLAKLLENHENGDLAAYGPKLEGAARRVQLIGQPLELAGETVDGEAFDWSQYRGKVVLVDFWATWCRPCVAEMPNVKKNYELYRDRGFDVVGISLDDDKDSLLEFLESKEIPWRTLYSSNPAKQGWDHPMATHYGVMGIPTVILVNREGQVVSLSARGPQLGKLLAELIGPPDVNDESKDGDAKEVKSDSE